MNKKLMTDIHLIVYRYIQYNTFDSDLFTNEIIYLKKPGTFKLRKTDYVCILTFFKLNFEPYNRHIKSNSIITYSPVSSYFTLLHVNNLSNFYI